MSTFNWCLTHDHENCPVKYQRFVIGPVGKGRKKKPNGIILLDEWKECDCHCHQPVEEKPKKKAAKKTTRRKK